MTTGKCLVFFCWYAPKFDLQCTCTKSSLPVHTIVTLAIILHKCFLFYNLGNHILGWVFIYRDTSGQGRFCTIFRSYSRGAQVCTVLYAGLFTPHVFLSPFYTCRRFEFSPCFKFAQTRSYNRCSFVLTK